MVASRGALFAYFFRPCTPENTIGGYDNAIGRAGSDGTPHMAGQRSLVGRYGGGRALSCLSLSS